MAEKNEQILQIASQLQPKYASYLRGTSDGKNLTTQERAILEAVRRRPTADKLEQLYSFTKFSNTNVLVRERAFGSLATALGIQGPEARSLWQRLNRMSPITGPGRRTPEPAEPYATGRQPGAGSARGGEPEVFGVEVSRSKVVDALVPLMDERFNRWYNEGSTAGLTVDEQSGLRKALQDPNNPDLAYLSRFAVGDLAGGAGRSFIDQASEIVRSQQEQMRSAEQAVAASTERAQTERRGYYDPQQSRVVFLTRSEAQSRGLAPATQQQVREEDRKASSNVAPPAGFEWQYDPVQSKPILVPTGTRLPTRAPSGAQTTGDGTGGTGGADGATSGVATTIPGVEMAPATGVIPEDWEQAAKEQYGAYWAIFQYQPELQQLLIDATREGWDPSKFQYQLEQTGWWKTTTESARLFDMEEATDPATMQTKIDNQVAAINQIALNFGVRLSSETAAKIARDSLRGGWATNPALMQTAITNEATKSTGGVSQLRAGYIGQQIREAANMYGVNLGDAELNSWVQKWASGAENQQSVTAAMQEWSKVLYPSIAQYIDQGRTFQDVVAPYKSIAAGLLELDPNQINFTEPKWLAAISQEDKAGQQKLMSASEWQREIRTNRDFGFEFTKQAQDQAYLVANQMAELFGRV